MSEHTLPERAPLHKLLLIPQTSWEREGAKTLAECLPELINVLEGVLDGLEKDPQGAFTFDGQVIAIEDYLLARPDNLARVSKLVRSGRLKIGPLYVQPDLFLPNAESMLRNFEEGIRSASAIGRVSNVAYLPSALGHPGQMPQVIRGFGMDRYVLSSGLLPGGLLPEGAKLGSTFTWQAPSGDSVVVFADQAGPATSDGLLEKIEEVLTARESGAKNTVLWASVGGKRTAYPEVLNETIARINAEHPEVEVELGGFDTLAKIAGRGQLERYSGDITDASSQSAYRSVNSTRMALKLQNFACERLLLNWLEPYSALLGGLKREELRPLWRTLLSNHVQSSISGTGTDSVHELDMPIRFESVQKQGEEVRDKLLQAGSKVVVYSSEAYAHSRVLSTPEGETLMRFVGLGPHPLVKAMPVAPVRSAREGWLDNGKLAVEVAPDGTFYVKGPGGRSGPHNVIVSEGERGDAYMHAGVGLDISSLGMTGVLSTRCSEVRGEVEVSYELLVPKGVDAGRDTRSEETVRLLVETTIQLDAEADFVSVFTRVNNGAKDQRLRVRFDSGVFASSHTVGEAFAWVERPNAPSGSDTGHMQDFVALADSQAGVLLTSKGLPEYGVTPTGNTLLLTLLRGVGVNKQDGLSEASSEADVTFDTPGAQMLGQYDFSYALVPLAGKSDLARGVLSARTFQDEPILGSTDINIPRALFTLSRIVAEAGGGAGGSTGGAGGNTGSATSASVAGSAGATGFAVAQLSALRPGSEPNTFIVRLVNPTDKPTRVQMNFSLGVEPIGPTDLRESEAALAGTRPVPLHVPALLCETKQGAYVARLDAFEVGTWRFRQVTDIDMYQGDLIRSAGQDEEVAKNLNESITSSRAQTPSKDTAASSVSDPLLRPLLIALLASFALVSLVVLLALAYLFGRTPVVAQGGVTPGASAPLVQPVTDPGRWQVVLLTNGDLYAGRPGPDGLADAYLVLSTTTQRANFIDLVNKGGHLEPVTGSLNFAESQVFMRITLPEDSILRQQLVNQQRKGRTTPGVVPTR